MGILKRAIGIICAVAFSATLLSGCSSSSKKVIVGSKNTTESLLIAEMYTQLLTENNFEAEHKQSLGDTISIHKAMVDGEISIYPEYTSEALVKVLNQKPDTDAMICYQMLNDIFEDQYGFILFDMASLSNNEGFAVKKSLVNDLGILTVSDLSKQASKLSLYTTYEFENSEYGLKGIKERLGGFDFSKIAQYEKGTLEETLKNEDVDVIVCSSTDTFLSKEDYYVFLEDDISFFPPNNLVPVVNGTLLETMPNVMYSINSLAYNLDLKTLQGLISKVEFDGMDYKEVVKEYLEENNLKGRG